MSKLKWDDAARRAKVYRVDAATPKPIEWPKALLKNPKTKAAKTAAWEYQNEK